MAQTDAFKWLQDVNIVVKSDPTLHKDNNHIAQETNHIAKDTTHHTTLQAYQLNPTGHNPHCLKTQVMWHLSYYHSVQETSPIVKWPWLDCPRTPGTLSQKFRHMVWGHQADYHRNLSPKHIITGNSPRCPRILGTLSKKIHPNVRENWACYYRKLLSVSKNTVHVITPNSAHRLRTLGSLSQENAMSSKDTEHISTGNSSHCERTLDILAQETRRIVRGHRAHYYS